MSSAFITGECGLALLALKETMHHTAKAADLIEAERSSIAALRPATPVWREQELARRAMTLYASLSVLRPHLAVKLSDDALTPLRKLGLGGRRVEHAESPPATWSSRGIGPIRTFSPFCTGTRWLAGMR